MLISWTALVPVLAQLTLIKTVNEQEVTLVVSHVLCSELLCVLVGRVMELHYMDILFLWLGAVGLWLWYCLSF